MSNSIKFQSAYTLLELLVALVVVSILTAVAIPAFGNYIQNAKINNAILDIKSIDAAIERRFSDNPNLPDSLSDIFNNVPVDPWGNPYRYLRIQGGDPANNGQKRKDHSLVPINSDYDLYSSGPNGRSLPPLTARHSRDDIVRANNGAFVGKAEDY
jgi:general secretion pathway protein G